MVVQKNPKIRFDLSWNAPGGLNASGVGGGLTRYMENVVKINNFHKYISAESSADCLSLCSAGKASSRTRYGPCGLGTGGLISITTEKTFSQAQHRLGRGRRNCAFSIRKACTWGCRLETILSNFTIYLLFRSLKTYLAQIFFSC